MASPNQGQVVAVEEDRPGVVVTAAGLLFALIGFVGVGAGVVFTWHRPVAIPFVVLVPAVFVFAGLRIGAVRRRIEVDPEQGQVRAYWGLFRPRMFCKRRPIDHFNEVHVRSSVSSSSSEGGPSTSYASYSVDLHSLFSGPLHVRNFFQYTEASRVAQELAGALGVAVTEDIDEAHMRFGRRW